MTTRHTATPLVPTRTLTNAATSGIYRPKWAPVRPGADDHEKVPSLRGTTRYFRNGRQEAA